MATLEEAARAVKSSLGTKQNKIEWQIATLGDGKGNVDAGNGYVLVRLKENSSTVEIINDGVSLTDGMLVRIEKPAHDPLHWHVVSKNDQRIDEVSTDPPGYNIGPHHRTHEYLGVDQVNADFRQITNLRVYAVSGTFTVGVLVGLIPRGGTNVKVPSQTLDLTSHVPATGARYCLISVDSTGVLVVTDGSIVDGIITLAITDIPATPTGNWRLAAVRLYAGQTAITESVTSNDMVDLRFPEERIAGNPLDVFGVQTANTYFAGPTTGSPALPTFRAGVTDDIASGVFPIARGGTNGSTATQALTNLLPSQAGQAGNVLGTNGTVASWVVPGGGGGGGTIVITSLPIGTIAPFGGSSIPSGWLECNGAAVSRTTYADLFAVTGTTYGAGDGSTTFNLPDMRGRTSIGQGTGSGLTPRSSGQTGGEETHVLTSAEMPAHTHGIDLYDASSGTPATTKTGSNAGNIATIQSGSAGGGGAHNTMPPFLVTTWIIKYTDTATSAFLYDDAGATISQVTLTASGTGVRIYAARDDHHHQLDQTIAPTMTGAWTFKGHDVNSIGDDQSAAFIHTQYSATKTASFLGQRARGSLASPSAIQANDTITRLIGRGYGATAFGASHRGAVEIVADENWTDSAQGARIDFYTTPNGGTSTAAAAHISSVGQFQGPSIALAATSNQLVLQSAGVTGTLTWTPTSSNKTITFPDATGTVALLSTANIFTAAQSVVLSKAGVGAGLADVALSSELDITSSYSQTMAALKVFNNFTGDAGANVSSIYGIRVFSGNNGSGAATHGIGIKIEAVTNTGTIANLVGLYVVQPSATSTGGNSAIHIDGPNGQIAFTGGSGLGINAGVRSPVPGELDFFGGTYHFGDGAAGGVSSPSVLISYNDTAQHVLDIKNNTVEGYHLIDGSKYVFGTFTAHPVYIRTNNLNAVTIDTSQNVLIGTGAVGSVSGPNLILTYADTGQHAFVLKNNNVEGYHLIDSGHYIFGTFTAHPVYIRSSNQTRLAVLSTGEVGIGTLTPSTLLHVVNTTTTTNAALEVSRIEARVSTASTGGAAGFGPALSLYGESATDTSYRPMGRVSSLWQTATDASAVADMVLEAYYNNGGTFTATEFLRGRGGASAAIGFLTATPIARYSSTGDLRQALIDFGLYTTGGASPLDLNGGLLTAGSAHIGDAATNYSAFAADGTLTMTGTAKVLKEVQVTVMSTRNGASAPTDANRAVGASGNVLLPVKQFSKTTQNDIYFELHPGSDIDSSVNVAIHFMWLPGSGWTSGNYLWNLEYLVKGENAAPYNTGTPTTITANVTPSNATDTIETVFGSTIALTWNQTIWCHFFRDVADTGDDTGDLRFVEMEYTANKLGE